MTDILVVSLLNSLLTIAAGWCLIYTGRRGQWFWTLAGAWLLLSGGACLGFTVYLIRENM